MHGLEGWFGGMVDSSGEGGGSVILIGPNDTHTRLHTRRWRLFVMRRHSRFLLEG